MSYDDLQHLENNEAVLLMYLAGELSPEASAEVEQMLDGNPSMRADLEALRRNCASAEQVLERLDALTVPPIPDAVAIRQATRLMKQWQAEQCHAARKQRAAAAAAAETRSLRFPWWSYPLATAAAIALALLVWWTNLDNLRQPATLSSTSSYADGVHGWGPAGFFASGLGTFGDDVLHDDPAPAEDLWAENLERSFDRSDEMLNDAVLDAGLLKAEQELAAIWNRHSDFPDALFVQVADQP